MFTVYIFKSTRVRFVYILFSIVKDDAEVLVAREELKATLDSIQSQEQNTTLTERCVLDPAIPITFTKVLTFMKVI